MMSNDLVTVATTLAIYTAVVVTPGPNFAVVTRLALSRGRSTAFGATLGLAVAATIYALVSMAGLAALLERIGWLSRGIQIAGGCYLVYLGVSAWMSAGHPEAGESPKGPRASLTGFRTGFLVCLSNPKSIAFFVGLYAVAIPATTALWAKAAIIVGGFSIEVLWYGLVTVLCSLPRPRSFYERSSAVIERAIGSLMAVVGVRLILDRA